MPSCAGERFSCSIWNDCPTARCPHARRKIGQWLAENVTAGNPQLSHSVRIDEVGIKPMESHRWQKLARVPDEGCEQYEAARTMLC